MDSLIHNDWLWVHVAGGTILSGFIYWLSRSYKFEEREKFAVFGVIIIAIIWECVEYLSGIGAYLDLHSFLVDALQDIGGAVIMAIITVIIIRKNQLFY